MKLVLDWAISNSGHGFGSVGWVDQKSGWPGFIESHVKPAIEWCKESGVEPVVLIHHPFGQYSELVKLPSNGTWEAMHLDGWDYANAAGQTWLTNEFSTKRGWKSVTSGTPCYCYVGGVDITPRLRNLPPADLAATITRNLKPMREAGFRGIYIDAAANAVSNMFVGKNAEQTTGRSLDTITLAIADRMFPEASGVEAAPRSFPHFQSLLSRNVIAFDDTWRHDMAADKSLGFDARAIKGEVWRRLHYSDDSAGVVKAAQAIASDGHVPVIGVQPLIRDGVKASEIFVNG